MSELDAICKKLNENEMKIVRVIFWHQRENPRGIRSNSLLKENPIKGSMSKTAFFNRLNSLKESGLVEQDISYTEGGQEQVYNRIKQDFFDLMCKESDVIEYLFFKREAELFIQSIQHYESDKYVVSVIEFLSGRLILLAINSMLQEDEDVRGTFYYDIWEKIKDLLDSLHIKTLKNKEEKKKAYRALLELLQPYSSRSIGKQVMLDKVYDGLMKVQAYLD
jgi:hypothetical protein